MSNNIFLIRINPSVGRQPQQFAKAANVPKGSRLWLAGENWMGAMRNDAKPMWYVIQELSSNYSTEAIGIIRQEKTQEFEVRCYAAGKETRKLLYSAGDAGWSHTTGSVQAWEESVWGSAEQADIANRAAPDQSTVAKLLKALGCQFPASDSAKKPTRKKSNWFMRLFGR